MDLQLEQGLGKMECQYEKKPKKLQKRFGKDEKHGGNKSEAVIWLTGDRNHQSRQSKV